MAATAEKNKQSEPQSISDDLVSLIRREPFWGRVVLSLKRKENRGIKTAGVSLKGGLTLSYNPDYYFSKSLAQRLAILEHEAMHVVNRHFAREKDIREGKSLFKAITPEAQKALNRIHDHCFHELMNYAADISINQFIKNIPAGCLSHKKYGFPAGLSMEEYVVLLLEEASKQPQGGNGDGDPSEEQGEGQQSAPADGGQQSSQSDGAGQKEDGQGQGDSATDQSNSQQGQGASSQASGRDDSQDGAGAGQGSPGSDPGNQSGIGSQTGNGQNGQAIGDGHSDCPICKGKLQRGELLGDHSGWDTGDGEVSDADIEEANAVAVSIVRDCHERGLIPANMLSQFDDILKPKVNWRQILRSFSASCRSDEVRRTWMRPNRRLPGRLKGKVSEEKLEIIVIVDSSGSISDQMLSQFSAEISGMAKEGSKVTVIECDAKVHRVYPFKDRIESVQGRGGTAFTPAFEHIAQNKLWADAIIYLTDGYGDDPAPFILAPVLWVVTAGGQRPVSWGKVLFLPED